MDGLYKWINIHVHKVDGPHERSIFISTKWMNPTRVNCLTRSTEWTYPTRDQYLCPQNGRTPLGLTVSLSPQSGRTPRGLTVSLSPQSGRTQRGINIYVHKVDEHKEFLKNSNIIQTSARTSGRVRYSTYSQNERTL